jgi:hypothetical protein
MVRCARRTAGNAAVSPTKTETSDPAPMAASAVCPAKSGTSHPATAMAATAMTTATRSSGTRLEGEHGSRNEPDRRDGNTRL